MKKTGIATCLNYSKSLNLFTTKLIVIADLFHLQQDLFQNKQVLPIGVLQHLAIIDLAQITPHH
jgi:hypothetical protein